MNVILEIKSSCIDCDNCRLFCPEQAIHLFDQTYHIDQWACTLCAVCIEICPVDCIKMINPEQKPQDL